MLTKVQTSYINELKKQSVPHTLHETLKFTEGLEEFKKKIDTHISTLKLLKNDLKKLESSYHHDLTKVWKNKRKKPKNYEKNGFVKNKALPDKLAKLINVENGTEMSMPEYTSKFYENVLNKRGLLYEKDKRVFRADKELMELFNLPNSVNESTHYKDKNGFNFSTLQKYFSKLMKDQVQYNYDSDKENEIDSSDENDSDSNDENNINNIHIKIKQKPKLKNKELIFV